MENPLRFIPKMDDFLEDGDILRYKKQLSGNVALKILREETEDFRRRVKSGEINVSGKEAAFELVKRSAAARLEAKSSDRLRRVINATGIIIHTNLGRAPLSAAAAERVREVVSGYNNLEYSVSAGERRGRMFYAEDLIKDITGAEAALVVNNNAAAVFLALNTLCKGRGVIVSRGEMVEIGDSFRISEIIKESGCIVREAGTTNKTRLSDYESLMDENTAALLKVHRSNFKIVGFTGEVSSLELAGLRGENALVIEDMGSGVLIDLPEHGLSRERTVMDALADGVDVVTFSGDKALGGPQAGIIAGKKKYVDLMRKNQMYRCLRIDKMCLAALEVTLRQYLSGDFMEIPALKSLLEPKEPVREKAGRLNALLAGVPGINSYAGPHDSVPGGGAMPGETIESFAVFVSAKGKTAAEIDGYLRALPVPVITTIRNGEVILDVRTVDEGDFGYVRDALAGWA